MARARERFSGVGPLLYRRPLTEDEVQDRLVEAAGMVADTAARRLPGNSLSLSDMLISPNFCCVQTHRAGPGARGPGAHERLRQGSGAELLAMEHDAGSA